VAGGGGGKKTVARRVGVDAKTARRYLAVAEGWGRKREAGTAGQTDELFGLVLLELEGWREREHGQTLAICESRRGRRQVRGRTRARTPEYSVGGLTDSSRRRRPPGVMQPALVTEHGVAFLCEKAPPRPNLKDGEDFSTSPLLNRIAPP